MATTRQRSIDLPEKVKPTGVESVKFRDGMVVTADDLEAAMLYPVSLLQTVLRAYLGCGVACGLGLRVKQVPEKDTPQWVVVVDRGVAVDCQGYPIELCGPLELDLSPESCSCDDLPEHVCIAIRRITSDEAPRDTCSCDVDAPHFDCRRVRDNVVVKAFTQVDFDALPSAVCRRKPKGDAMKGEAPETIRSCLTACPERCCGDCWILLGCVNLNKDKGITGTDSDGRKWVKPTECAHTVPGGSTEELASLMERITKLEKDLSDRMHALEGWIGLASI